MCGVVRRKNQPSCKVQIQGKRLCDMDGLHHGITQASFGASNACLRRTSWIATCEHLLHTTYFVRYFVEHLIFGSQCQFPSAIACSNHKGNDTALTSTFFSYFCTCHSVSHFTCRWACQNARFSVACWHPGGCFPGALSYRVVPSMQKETAVVFSRSTSLCPRNTSRNLAILCKEGQSDAVRSFIDTRWRGRAVADLPRCH